MRRQQPAESSLLICDNSEFRDPTLAVVQGCVDWVEAWKHVMVDDLSRELEDEVWERPARPVGPL